MSPTHVRTARREKSNALEKITAASAENRTQSDRNEQGDHKVLLESLKHMMARIQTLERKHKMLQEVSPPARDVADVDQGLHHDSPPEDDLLDDGCNTPMFPSNGSVHSRTSLREMIDVVEHNIASEESSVNDVAAQIAKPTQWHLVDHTGEKKTKRLTTIERITRSKGADQFRHHLRTYFTHLNPHYPCLDEDIVMEQFETFFRDDHDGMPDKFQLLALINMISATVLVLSDTCEGSSVPDIESLVSHDINYLMGCQWMDTDFNVDIGAEGLVEMELQTNAQHSADMDLESNLYSDLLHQQDGNWVTNGNQSYDASTMISTAAEPWLQSDPLEGSILAKPF
ncbi:hypothetical protein MBLNU459_g7078t1 [Dothideomycetes sp. NU459]